MARVVKTLLPPLRVIKYFHAFVNRFLSFNSTGHKKHNFFFFFFASPWHKDALNVRSRQPTSCELCSQVKLRCARRRSFCTRQGRELQRADMFRESVLHSNELERRSKTQENQSSVTDGLPDESTKVRSSQKEGL